MKKCRAEFTRYTGNRFPIASCTKALTAMTIGLLVDDGQLDWDRSIREFLPN
ncbi:MULTISPECIES: serine hydrolase [unclassified Microcoleus]|uniref:serine hydrolase n=1 Tax=unclassified Microcoleus TaxID=2642155 RepID=UPI0040408781